MHQQVLVLSDSVLANIHDADKGHQTSESVVCTLQHSDSVLSNTHYAGCKEQTRLHCHQNMNENVYMVVKGWEECTFGPIQQ